MNGLVSHLQLLSAARRKDSWHAKVETAYTNANKRRLEMVVLPDTQRRQAIWGKVARARDSQVLDSSLSLRRKEPSELLYLSQSQRAMAPISQFTPR